MCDASTGLHGKGEDGPAVSARHPLTTTGHRGGSSGRAAQLQTTPRSPQPLEAPDA